MRFAAFLSLCVVGTTLPARHDANACVHATANVAVSQSGQQMIAVHDGSVEHLFINVEYQASTAPTALAMVIPLPALPDSFATADADLFRQVGQWVQLRREVARSASSDRLRSRMASPAAVPDLQVFAPVRVGPYEIRPLRAAGSAGAAALTDWLARGQFRTIPPAALEYYITRGWTFVTVRVAAPAASTALAPSGSLPPLRLTFSTPRIVFPLRLEAQGQLTMRLYAITSRALSASDLAGATARGFEIAGAPGQPYVGPARSSTRGGGSAPSAPLTTSVSNFALASAPTALRDALASTSLRSGGGQLWVRTLIAERFGAATADPSQWAEEMSIPPLPAGARLEGSR